MIASCRQCMRRVVLCLPFLVPAGPPAAPPAARVGRPAGAWRRRRRRRSRARAGRRRARRRGGPAVPERRACRPGGAAWPRAQYGRGPPAGRRPRPAGDQRHHEEPRVQLVGVVPQLADMALVQRAPGRVGEQVTAGELIAYLPGRRRSWRRARPRVRAAPPPDRPGAPGQRGTRGRRRRRTAVPRTVRRSRARASGEPSWSCRTRWSRSAGTALAGTSSVTTTGQGVPSASMPRSVTAATSAAPMKPRSGANTPEVSSSRSPSCASSRVSAGQSGSSAGSPGGG